VEFQAVQFFSMFCKPVFMLTDIKCKQCDAAIITILSSNDYTKIYSRKILFFVALLLEFCLNRTVGFWI